MKIIRTAAHEQLDLFSQEPQEDPSEVEWRRIQQEADERDRVTQEWLAGHTNIPFQVRLRNGRADQYVVIHPSSKTKGSWQVTGFDQRGPWGDTELSSYAKAVQDAVQYWQVDLKTAQPITAKPGNLGR